MPRHNAQMRLLKAQIDILRARIPSQRIILSPAEKAELLRIGAECGHEVDGLLEVAKPATYKRWLSQMRHGRPFKAVGRPRLTQELRDAVIRIGSENTLWGYRRIVGELKKPGALCRCKHRQTDLDRRRHSPKPGVQRDKQAESPASIKMRLRGVVSRREGVARLERYHPRVSPQVGGSDGRDLLG